MRPPTSVLPTMRSNRPMTGALPPSAEKENQSCLLRHDAAKLSLGGNSQGGNRFLNRQSQST